MGAAGFADLAGGRLALGLHVGQLRLEIFDLFHIFLDGGAEHDGVVVQLLAVDVEVPVVIAQAGLQLLDGAVARGDLAVEFADFQQVVGLVGHVSGDLACGVAHILGQFNGLVGDVFCQLGQFV